MSLLRSVLALAATAIVMDTNTIRSPEEADLHDLERSKQLRDEIANKRKQMNQDAYESAAEPYREARRKRKAAMLARTKP